MVLRDEGAEGLISGALNLGPAMARPARVRRSLTAFIARGGQRWCRHDVLSSSDFNATDAELPWRIEDVFSGQSLRVIKIAISAQDRGGGALVTRHSTDKMYTSGCCRDITMNITFSRQGAVSESSNEWDTARPTRGPHD